MDKLYTVNDIATMTRLSTRTIRRYLSNGELSGQKIGRQWRFTQSDLESFLDSQALIDQLDTEEQQRKQEFQTGKILVQPENPQADLTVIRAFTSTEALTQYQTAILELFNTHFEHSNLSLSVRRLPNLNLRLVLFGDLTQIQHFVTHSEKIKE